MSKLRRRPELWMSSNRVLSGGTPKVRPASLTGKKSHPHRNPNFETSETKLLISLWGDPKVQKALITTHRKHPVISKIAEQMQQRGYYRTPEEINTRIKNLKCFYNRIKKDLDAGVIPYPTWKHYPAMDKIMTTPVFSARPEEMPKPSPRFKLELETSTSESRSDAGSDDESFPANLLTTELTYDDDDDGEIPYGEDRKSFMERHLDIDVEEVIVPKEEPIEVDDDDEEPILEDMNAYEGKEKDADEANEIFPKLSAYLQLSSNNQPTASSTKVSNKIITTIASNGPTSTSDTNTSGAGQMKVGQPMVLAQQQSQQGKISLVPTNILLKPPQQQLQLRPQAQHILYNTGISGNPGIAATGTPAQMPNGMKVILVNTLPKNSIGTVSAANEAQQKFITTNAMKANCITSTVPNLGEARIKAAESRNHKPTVGSGAGFRTLISQLISIQTQNLDVSRQRLEVERQRLDFEKSIAERIMAVLPQILTPSAQPPPPPPPTPNEDRATPTMPLLTPKIEKEQD